VENLWKINGTSMGKSVGKKMWEIYGKSMEKSMDPGNIYG
jgi:hypothetical protein